VTSTFAPRESSRLAIPTSSGAAPKRRLPLVEQYLREQQTLSAVERFAQRHAEETAPAHERFYRDLLPAAPPGPGQQYAFQVDLDACTGCKACVTACHNLNGLDESEAWRNVGLLHGGTASAPVQQTVTTACHHCLDPACMKGCPVGAYEKDPRTGIVKHLDDQCIGCQYCTFTCPYDVPKYSEARGIVRKCDMCSGRLEAGEAPACVQACPNQAISIAVVDQAKVRATSSVEPIVPGAPSSAITAPTTAYKTKRGLPRDLLPANFHTIEPAHAHRPLVVMLVLTQLSAGAFCVDALGAHLLPRGAASLVGTVHALVAMTAGLAALAASTLHLGRPLYAFRALLGLRTSWMSREILAFGVFAPLAMLYAASFWLGHWVPPEARTWLCEAVAASGVLGVACSVLIYHVTRRAWWRARRTAFKFFGTAAVLGLATAGLTIAIGAVQVGGADRAALAGVSAHVARWLLVAGLVKGLGELSALRHLRDPRYTDLRKSAVLLTRDLARYTAVRFVLLGAGLLLTLAASGGWLSVPLAAATLVLFTLGEAVERTLFFAAMCAPGMPGGLD
jgi:Fe-S-cluster-containing dehydrogenase component/DMSO reductase anchor subunit